VLLLLLLCCLPQAPPGAGKTTTVPLALLLHAPEYLKQGQTIMVSGTAGLRCRCHEQLLAALFLRSQIST
jgi:hypothetical protein